MIKKLISAGCSFSETESNACETWPLHLIKNLSGYDLISKGMSCQGNGLISKSVIWEVARQLRYVSPEDIIVGVEWSGTDRHEVYVNNPSQTVFNENINGWLENPTQFAHGFRNWEILNHHWDTKKSKLYYKHFYTQRGKFIETLENMLRVQNFLEKYNIKYFMTTMQSIFPPDQETGEIQHLIDLIDQSVFLPVKGMWEWAKEHNASTGTPMHPDGFHPSSQQHKIFTETIIMPFLKNRYNI